MNAHDTMDVPVMLFVQNLLEQRQLNLLEQRRLLMAPGQGRIKLLLPVDKMKIRKLLNEQFPCPEERRKERCRLDRLIRGSERQLIGESIGRLVLKLRRKSQEGCYPEHN